MTYDSYDLLQNAITATVDRVGLGCLVWSTSLRYHCYILIRWYGVHELSVVCLVV